MSAPAQPATGVDWKTGGFDVVDNRFFSRGPLCAVLIRDNRGSATDISPYAAGTTGGPPPPPVYNWSPLAVDGTLRSDLFAYIRVDGQWQVNAAANEGWWLIGAVEERQGPDRKANIRHDDAMILQSNFPFDSDIIQEGITIAFTGVEVFKPLLMRLRMNLPLSDSTGTSIVEGVGDPNFVLSKPVDAESIDRQLLLVFAKKRTGKTFYTVEGYPLCKLTDIGNVKRSKTDPDAPALTWTVLPDPYHVDLDPSNPTSAELVQTLYSFWMGGDAWAALKGP
jgi:hypothetical protein